jgi:hypothetical protein
MAALNGRLRRLERAAGVRGVCPECEGRGAPTFEVWIDGERQGPGPRGCGRCGRTGVIHRLCIDDPADTAMAPAGAGRAS